VSRKRAKVTFHDQHGRETVCLVSLSDAWRRKAEFNRPKLAAAFNKEARNLCAAVQYLDLDGAAAWPGDHTRRSLGRLEKLADRYDIDRVILPVYEDSPAGEWLTKVLDNRSSDSNVVLDLQSALYVSRLDKIGKVDARRRTALDYGLAYVKK
jgi:hypothetical protein